MRQEHLIGVRDRTPTLTTTITAMESLGKRSEEEDATSCLVVGTEHRQLCVLDTTSFAIVVKAVLPSVPVFICTSGLLDVEYRCARGREGERVRESGGEGRGRGRGREGERESGGEGRARARERERESGERGESESEGESGRERERGESERGER